MFDLVSTMGLVMSITGLTLLSRSQSWGHPWAAEVMPSQPWVRLRSSLNSTFFFQADFSISWVFQALQLCLCFKNSSKTSSKVPLSISILPLNLDLCLEYSHLDIWLKNFQVFLRIIVFIKPSKMWEWMTPLKMLEW